MDFEKLRNKMTRRAGRAGGALEGRRMGGAAAWIPRIAALGAFVTLSACARDEATLAELSASSPWPDAPAVDQILLRAGDSVEIRFTSHPEFNDLATQTIRPDGKISMPYIDEVQAAGLTPAGLDEALTEALKSELMNPSLTVFVRSQINRRIYVGGEVGAPGVVPMPGSMNLTDALMQAGGFNLDSAEPSNVIVIRYVDGVRYHRIVNMDLEGVLYDEDITAADLPETDLPLAPLDVVYVPRTKITRINQWIDQYINQMIPSVFRDILFFATIDNDE